VRHALPSRPRALTACAAPVCLPRLRRAALPRYMGSRLPCIGKRMPPPPDPGGLAEVRGARCGTQRTLYERIQTADRPVWTGRIARADGPLKGCDAMNAYGRIRWLGEEAAGGDCRDGRRCVGWRPLDIRRRWRCRAEGGRRGAGRAASLPGSAATGQGPRRNRCPPPPLGAPTPITHHSSVRQQSYPIVSDGGFSFRTA
jgi:hypothetical protein